MLLIKVAIKYSVYKFKGTLGAPDLKVACVLTLFSLSFFHSVLRQNAELAKVRQECAKLTKELGEKTESLLADEHIRKGLEAKISATEKQLSLLQVGPACGNTTSSHL